MLSLTIWSKSSSKMFLEILHWQDVGIGNEDVDFAKVLDSGVEYDLDIIDAASISLDSRYTVTANLFDELTGRGEVGDVVNHDRSSVSLKTGCSDFIDA